MNNKIIQLVGLVFLLLNVGCSDFLDEKSDTKLVVPETLRDNQALLDRIANILASNSISGQISSDEIYITDSDYNGISYEADKRLYIWQPNLVARATGNDWGSCYFRINICNTVLNNLEQYEINNAENVKGQALALQVVVARLGSGQGAGNHFVHIRVASSKNVVHPGAHQRMALAMPLASPR